MDGDRSDVRAGLAVRRPGEVAIVELDVRIRPALEAPLRPVPSVRFPQLPTNDEKVTPMTWLPCCQFATQ